MTDGGVRGWLSGDGRGQSSPLGYLLVIAIVLAGTITIVALGTSALQSTRGQSELQRAEHSMTLFDSRAAMVALGASTTQTVSFGQDSGSFQTDPNAGWIAIEHHNYTEDGDNVEVIYNRSLGRMVYTNDDTEIAYQGGGVWRKDGTGDAVMVSPPEFHYRRATLTLPIIRVRSNGRTAGTSRVTVSQDTTARAVFPNTTSYSGNGTGAPYDYDSTNGPPAQYENPIKNGTVFAWVHSRYYRGWASYFKQRTTGNVTVYDKNETVRLELLSFGGAPGAFTLPQTGDSVGAGGMSDGHPLKRFEVTLDIRKNKPHFSFYATNSGKEFALHVYSPVNPSNHGCSIPSDKVWIGVFYHNGGSNKAFESFETASMVDPNSVPWMDWQCSGGNLKLRIDFLNSHSMTYDDFGSYGSVDPGIDDPSAGGATGVTLGNKYAFNDQMRGDLGWHLNSTAVWDQHEASVSYEGPGYTFSPGGTDTEPMSHVVNHYLQLMGPDVDLVSKTGPGSSDPINEPTSSGALDYDETKGSQFIAFLHVTENDIDVDFD
ncbi:MAG: hypothetical protein ABEI77_01180 [Halorientalis sp.]